MLFRQSWIIFPPDSEKKMKSIFLISIKKILKKLLWTLRMPFWESWLQFLFYKVKFFAKIL